MELLSAFLGAIVGGALSYWGSTSQFKKERKLKYLEEMQNNILECVSEIASGMNEYTITLVGFTKSDEEDVILLATKYNPSNVFNKVYLSFARMEKHVAIANEFQLIRANYNRMMEKLGKEMEIFRNINSLITQHIECGENPPQKVLDEYYMWSQGSRKIVFDSVEEECLKAISVTIRDLAM